MCDIKVDEGEMLGAKKPAVAENSFWLLLKQLKTRRNLMA